MKKNKLGWLLAVPALFGFGMTSCQSNDIADEYIETEGELVEVSLTAVMPEADTRATLEPNGEKRKFSWESIDLIHVVNADNGTYLGKLGVKDISTDGTSCQFNGSITIPKNATNLHFNYYYLGSEGTIEKNGSSLADMAVSFTEQDGSIASMVKHDILTGKGAYETSAAARKSLGTIKFTRYFAAGYFILKYENTVLDINGIDVVITPEAGTMYTDATLNFQNQNFAKSADENPSIKVQVTSDEEKRDKNAFFVNFVPTENLQLKFTCTTKDGQSFVGTTKSAWKIGSADYFTKNTAGNPIEIVMRHTDGRDDERDYTLTYNSNFDTNVAIPDVVRGTVSAEIAVKDYTAVGSEDNRLPLRTYYSFTGWAKTSEGDVEYTSSDKITFAWNDENKTVNLYAKWQWSKYLIKFEKNDDTEKGDLPKNIDGNVTDGQNPSVSLPKEGDDDFKLSKDGYEFVGWKVKGTDDNNIVSNPYTVTETNPEVTLVPVWKVKQSGGTVTAPVAPGDEL